MINSILPPVELDTRRNIDSFSEDTPQLADAQILDFDTLRRFTGIKSTTETNPAIVAEAALRALMGFDRLQTRKIVLRRFPELGMGAQTETENSNVLQFPARNP